MHNGKYQYVRLTASGPVKAANGRLRGFFVASGTPTLALYDSLTGAGTLILNTAQLAAATPYPLPVVFTNGLYAVLTGAGDITFLYE